LRLEQASRQAGRQAGRQAVHVVIVATVTNKRHYRSNYSTRVDADHAGALTVAV
jgi:hypothetical protein